MTSSAQLAAGSYDSITSANESKLRVRSVKSVTHVCAKLILKQNFKVKFQLTDSLMVKGQHLRAHRKWKKIKSLTNE